jgi:preprotein translocase subunit SecD
MLLGVLGGNLFSPSNWHKDFKVGLGLDLSSGTVVIMKATTPNGGIPAAGEMDAAKSIILSRVNGTGNSGATVQTQGNDILTVSVPGKTTQQTVQLVSSTALLRFRPVLLEQAYTGTSTSPSASASPSGSASPSASASHSASTSASPTASATSTAKTSAKIVPAATAGASASPTASASATAHSSASPSPSASSSSSTSSTVYGNQAAVDKNVLKLFGKLVCPVNPTNQDAWKKQAGYTTSGDYDTPGLQTVSCDTSGNKYVLGAAAVQGTDVTSATAALDPNTNGWGVNVTLNGKGASAFGALTEHQYATYAPTASTNQNNFVLNQIAVVLDGNIVTTPQTQGALTSGNFVINGSSFTQATATQLQNVLKYGSLPVHLAPQSVQSVSPTLGRTQLDAGLLAGAIGLILVVIYSFLYYRGLGLVSISSLVIAGMLGYLAVVLLSKYQNFTLSLAGIAGLIVAIGITADSFVVFFERLRDEVREGKQLRPAVEAGWRRARRTVLVSDTVSFLAAVLLYYFSISDVKGFAYTLGLTTLIDVVVVFLFTKPMVTLVARTKFFGNGHRLSGLDPARLGARAPWRSSVPRARARAGSGAARSARNTGEA